jgi:hypothetical protein
MPTKSRARAITVAGLAILLLVTAWVGTVDRSLPRLSAQQTAAPIEAPERTANETFGAADVQHAVIAPVPTGSRIVDHQRGPVWVLAALAAALAAVPISRRRHDGQGIVARSLLLRGSVARRAPPLASFA